MYALVGEHRKTAALYPSIGERAPERAYKKVHEEFRGELPPRLRAIHATVRRDNLTNAQRWPLAEELRRDFIDAAEPVDPAPPAEDFDDDDDEAAGAAEPIAAAPAAADYMPELEAVVPAAPPVNALDIQAPVHAGESFSPFPEPYNYNPYEFSSQPPDEESLTALINARDSSPRRRTSSPLSRGGKVIRSKSDMLGSLYEDLFGSPPRSAELFRHLPGAAAAYDRATGVLSPWLLDASLGPSIPPAPPALVTSFASSGGAFASPVALRQASPPGSVNTLTAASFRPIPAPTAASSSSKPITAPIAASSSSKPRFSKKLSWGSRK